MINVSYFADSDFGGVLTTVPGGETWMILDFATRHLGGTASTMRFTNSGGSNYLNFDIGGPVSEAQAVRRDVPRGSILNAGDVIRRATGTGTVEHYISYVKLT